MKGTTTLELPRIEGSAGLARLIVTAHGSSLGSEQLKNANVMVSELVSNAFQHGEGQICLTVESGPDGVWARCPTRASPIDRHAGPAPGTPRLGAPVRGSARGLVGRRGRRGAGVVPRRRHGTRAVSAASSRLRSAAPFPKT